MLSIFVVLVCHWPAMSASPQAPITAERVAVHNVTPSRMLRMLRTGKVSDSGGAVRPVLPAGVNSIMPDERAGVLVVRGTAAAIATVRSLVALTDVRPRETTIEFTVMRYLYAGNGLPQVDTVFSQRMLATNNDPVRMDLGSSGATVHLECTPRVNGDNTVTLIGSARIGFEDTPQDLLGVHAIQIHHRLMPGQERLVGGVAAASSTAAQDLLDSGVILERPGDGAIYYLRVAVLRGPVDR